MTEQKVGHVDPGHIIASLSLAGISAGVIEFTDNVAVHLMGGLIFCLSCASTVQLYWALIFPVLKKYLRQNKTYVNFCIKNRILKLIRIYLRLNFKFIMLSSNSEETKLMGYLNGLIAFLTFFILIFILFLFKIVGYANNLTFK